MVYVPGALQEKLEAMNNIICTVYYIEASILTRVMF